MALLNPENDNAGASRLSAVTRGPKATGNAGSAVAKRYAAALHELDQAQRRLRTELADHLGLTHNEYDAFIFIAENRPTTPKDLAGTLRFTTGATTAMIDRLENVDLVHRIPNPNDRRSVLIEPTPHGSTRADWLIETYARLAADAVSSHDTLTPRQLTDAIRHTAAVITETLGDDGDSH